MSVFTSKPFADGTLPTSKGTLYAAPADVLCSYVKRIAFHNDNAAEQTILVYVNFTGTSRKWRRYVLAQNESVDLLDHGDVLHLGPNDLLEAQTTTGSAVSYIVTGVEERE